MNSLIDNLFEICVKNKDNPKADIVDNELALKSWLILRYMEINTLDDAILFLISMSTVNAYIKQKNEDHINVHFQNWNRGDYWFKSECSVKLMLAIDKNKLYDVHISFNPNERYNQNCLFFTISNMQFSFHGVDKIMPNYIPSFVYSNDTFNEVQNSRSIYQLLEYFYHNAKDFTNKTEDGENLLDFIQAKMDDINKIDDAKEKFNLIHSLIYTKLKYKYAFKKMPKSKNKYIPCLWESFGPSGDPSLAKIFKFYKKEIILEKQNISFLNGKTLTISNAFEYKCPKQLANIINLIAKHNCKYETDVNKVDIFVKKDLYDEKTGQFADQRYQKVQELILQGKQITVISSEQLLQELKISQLDLMKLEYPPSDWVHKYKYLLLPVHFNYVNQLENQEVTNNVFERADKLLK